MLDKNTIRTLMLLPEVDLEKARALKFSNGDKSSATVDLGNNPDVPRAAFFAIRLSSSSSTGDSPITSGF